MASRADSGISKQGSTWVFGGNDNWDVNLGGTGNASGVPGASFPWLYAALALGALWFLKK